MRAQHFLTIPLQVKMANIRKQPMPSTHAKQLCAYHDATPEVVTEALDGALEGTISLPAHRRTPPEQERMADTAAELVSATATYASYVVFRGDRNAVCRHPVRTRAGEPVVDQAIGTQASSRCTSPAAPTSFASCGRSQRPVSRYIARAGETGAKNLHIVHPSADTRNRAMQGVRGAFEHQARSAPPLRAFKCPPRCGEQGDFRTQLANETANSITSAYNKGDAGSCCRSR